MAGSSIAAPDAAPWVTDFVNAAFHRRPRDERQVEDFRLAWAILTTRWHQLGGRRLHVHDLAPVVRAFGVRRFTPGRGWGTLELEALMAGAGRLLGDWFPAAWEDPARRGWGVVFEDAAARAAFDPGGRLRHAALGPVTPPVAPERRTWHTYEPVRIAAGGAAAAAALAQADRWTEWATPLARFTAMRAGPTAAGQTFEIDVLAEPARGLPVLTRGYVTATAVLGPGPELDAEVAAMDAQLETPAVPAGARPRRWSS